MPKHPKDNAPAHEPNKSIGEHARDAAPHDGHDGTQDEAHSQPKHGGTHHDMADRKAAEANASDDHDADDY